MSQGSGNLIDKWYGPGLEKKHLVPAGRTQPRDSFSSLPSASGFTERPGPKDSRFEHHASASARAPLSSDHPHSSSQAALTGLGTVPGSSGFLFQEPARSVTSGPPSSLYRLETNTSHGTYGQIRGQAGHGPIRSTTVSIPTQVFPEARQYVRPSSKHAWDPESPVSRSSSEFQFEAPIAIGSGTISKTPGRGPSQRRPSNRDEFDGPHQFLERPIGDTPTTQDQILPHQPTNLFVQEQDQVLSQLNDRLSECAFDFVAKYKFPVPLEADKRPISRPADREWTEWVYLLKRLATKRRIPARVLHNGQIKSFVTVLENSVDMQHAAKHQSRPLKDDRNILQLISAGIQVTKILMDAEAMAYLDTLYSRTERMIQGRRSTPGFFV